MRFDPDMVAYLSRHADAPAGRPDRDRDPAPPGHPARARPPSPAGDTATAWIEGIGELTTTIA